MVFAFFFLRAEIAWLIKQPCMAPTVGRQFSGCTSIFMNFLQNNAVAFLSRGTPSKGGYVEGREGFLFKIRISSSGPILFAISPGIPNSKRRNSTEHFSVNSSTKRFSSLILIELKFRLFSSIRSSIKVALSGKGLGFD